ncbi:hypothetical protein SK128_010995 [Halocaridina rubra]|uniref:Uncharacterized protein n=1 Tax=Halocaridina rubra TaxID=373956 RepID=A0AAN8XK33_HALRR
MYIRIHLFLVSAFLCMCIAYPTAVSRNRNTESFVIRNKLRKLIPTLVESSNFPVFSSPEITNSFSQSTVQDEESNITQSSSLRADMPLPAEEIDEPSPSSYNKGSAVSESPIEKNREIASTSTLRSINVSPGYKNKELSHSTGNSSEEAQLSIVEGFDKSKSQSYQGFVITPVLPLPEIINNPMYSVVTKNYKDHQGHYSFPNDPNGQVFSSTTERPIQLTSISSPNNANTPEEPSGTTSNPVPSVTPENVITSTSTAHSHGHSISTSVPNINMEQAPGAVSDIITAVSDLILRIREFQKDMYGQSPEKFVGFFPDFMRRTFEASARLEGRSINEEEIQVIRDMMNMEQAVKDYSTKVAIELQHPNSDGTFDLQYRNI